LNSEPYWHVRTCDYPTATHYDLADTTALI
jgi:hypothetical protein